MLYEMLDVLSWLWWLPVLGQLDIAGALYRALQMQRFMREQQALPMQGLEVASRLMEMGVPEDQVIAMLQQSYGTQPDQIRSLSPYIQQSRRQQPSSRLSKLETDIMQAEQDLLEQKSYGVITEEQYNERRKRLSDYAEDQLALFESQYGATLKGDPSLQSSTGRVRSRAVIPGMLRGPKAVPVAPQSAAEPAGHDWLSAMRERFHGLLSGGQQMMGQVPDRLNRAAKAKTGGDFVRSLWE